MNTVSYKGKIWASKHKEFDPSLLHPLTSKNHLLVLRHGKPPYRVTFGVPHQAKVGEEHICDKTKKRPSDENAASYVLAAFSILKEHDIPCKLVIFAHSTTKDPNKNTATPYWEEIFQNDTKLLFECHGLGEDKKLDIELSAGQNDTTDTKKYGQLLASSLKNLCDLGVQKEAGKEDAIIYRKDGTKDLKGKLQKPGIETGSLKEAQKRKLPSLHLEAKPRFRIPEDISNTVTPDGLILGQALAQVIIRDWMGDELQNTEKSYTAQALNMTGAYHREIECTKEYHGRQLLELLQNADDEAEQAEDPSVLIMLEPNRLVVANNGSPFSRRGVLSFMYSDNSPKIKRLKKIGYKGLGFRAVLNWSESILIKSGSFSLEFSRLNAVAFLKKLLEKKLSLQEDIKEASPEEYPIATLSVPTWKEKTNSEASEYDTCVIINFSSDDVWQDIQSQINQLGMEVVLFLNNVTKIKLESSERQETILKVPAKKGYEEIQLLNEQGSVIQSKKWRIFSKNGEIPENLRKGELKKQYEYDLRIAVSENIDDDINRLFSYFKTETKFPFPAIIHGTFDLDGTRNHLNQNTVNEFLLGKLAELMIDTAIKLTQTSKKITWDAMKLLAKKGEFDDKVEKMRFYDKLLISMKSHKLIPVLLKKYMSPDEGPVFYETPLADVLKVAPDEFHDLALHTSDDDIQSLVAELGIGKYEPEELVKKINTTSLSLSPQDRAKLIMMLANDYKEILQPLKPENMPSLFVDERGRLINSKTQALLPPERSKFQLPENIRIVFIYTDLLNLLKNKAGTKTSRALADKLECFNVQEYRFDTVIRRVVTLTNRLIRKNESKRIEYIKNMLNSLYLIFSDDTDPDKKFPEAVNVPLFTRSGDTRNAQELYFGKEYSAGRIMDALYSGIDNSVFIAKKEDLGFVEQSEGKVVDFLNWIGVAEFPRIIQRKLEGESYDREYEHHVLRNLEYPYQTNWGKIYPTYDRLKREIIYQSEITIAYIDALDDILNKSRFEDILAWLHSDPKIQDALRNGHEPPISSFGLWLYKKHQLRDLDPEEISSYILYKLKNNALVTTRSGKKVRPEICCLHKTLIDMSPLIEIPTFDVKDEVFKTHGITQDDVEYVLVKAGVSRDFASLPDEIIYAVLKKLDSADPEGKKARIIYRQIIESKPREWAKNIVHSNARKEFIEKGKLLAKRNGELGYFPVKDVYYVDNITFCKDIMNKFLIVQIDRRSGKEKVRDIFGVKPLEDVRFTLTATPETHPINAQFVKALESFKPYILVFRLAKPTLKTELNQLKRLKIVLCNEILSTYRFDDVENQLRLNPYEHIQAGDENTAYLLLDPNKQYRDLNDLKSDIKFCDSIAEIITGILKVGENRKDYRELFSKDRHQKDLVIQSDLDDPKLEKLRQARELFHSFSEAEHEFWQAVLEVKGSDKILAEHISEKDILGLIAEELSLEKSLLGSIYENIYYEDFSSVSNMPYLKQLFQMLNMTVEEFNRCSSEQIDFTGHLKSEITNEKYRLLNKFKSYVFQLLKDKPLDIKETFTSLVEAFQNHPLAEDYDINKELTLDKTKYFDAVFQMEPFKSLGVTYSALFRQKEADLEEQYRKHLTVFEERLGQSGSFFKEDTYEFLDVSKNKSLLFFGKYDELINRFNSKYTRPFTTSPTGKGQPVTRKKRKISLNGKEEEYEENDYQPLIDNMDEDLQKNDYDIASYHPSRPPDTAGQTTRGGGGRGPAQRKQTKETGFLGEYYAYKALVKKYSQERVSWVSKYAKIANINPQGNDAEGYDIRYLNENDQVHYVEVKSSNEEDYSFSISPSEVRFGEEHKFNYEVILVHNALGQGRKLINLGNIFVYDEDESFNNNSKFTVENDGFRIKFE